MLALTASGWTQVIVGLSIFVPVVVTAVITYVVLAVMLAGAITGLHRLLAAGILVIGASALAWTVTHRPGQRRTTSSYGVLLDWLMNVLPRALYLVLFVLVTALGLIGVIVG